MSLNDVDDSFSLNSSPFSFNDSGVEYTHDPLDFSPSFDIAGLVTGGSGQVPFVNSEDDNFDYDADFTFTAGTNLLLVPNITISTLATLGSLKLSGATTVDTIETTVTDDDTHIPTSGAVVDYVTTGLSGNIDGSGTVDQVAVFSDSDSIEGDINLTYASASGLLTVANIDITGSLTVDSLTEYSADTGVTVDGIKLETNTPTNTIIVPSSGQSNINLNVYAKGTGLFTMGQGSSPAYLRGDSISIQDDDIILGTAGTDTILRHDPSGVGSPAGSTLTIKGGNAYAVGDNAGGDLVLWAGVGNGSGADGDIYLKQNDVYIGDGAANAYLSAQSTETSVIYYDTTTGLLSYRAHNIIDTTTVNVATYDLLTTDYILHVTYTGTAAVTSLTLPTAQCVDGRLVIIKDAGGNASVNNITVDTEGAETIDGAATAVISGDYDSITLYSNGTNWYII